MVIEFYFLKLKIGLPSHHINFQKRIFENNVKRAKIEKFQESDWIDGWSRESLK